MIQPLPRLSRRPPAQPLYFSQKPNFWQEKPTVPLVTKQTSRDPQTAAAKNLNEPGARGFVRGRGHALTSNPLVREYSSDDTTSRDAARPGAVDERADLRFRCWRLWERLLILPFSRFFAQIHVCIYIVLAN